MSRDITVELNVNSDVMSRKFPRVKVQPIVWNLYLKPVDDFLFKDTISVAQAISPGWVIQRSHTVEKTRSQPAETAVAESSVMLLRYDILDSKAKVFQTSYKIWLAMILDEWRSASIPRATSFKPTLSIALSNALPIKNSNERSRRT